MEGEQRNYYPSKHTFHLAMRQGIELVDEDISSFEPKRAVKFFRDLIWASASNAGIQTDTHVNLNIYTPDGGIDAEVEDEFEMEVTEADETDLIPKGRTGYQIKTGSKPSESDCENELMNSDDEIKSYVKDVVSSGGNYVYVTFSQLTSEEREERISAIENQLSEEGYDTCDVYLFATSQLVKFANHFPGIIFKYSSIKGGGIDIETWSERRPIRVPETYVETDERRAIVEKIRSLLTKTGEFEDIDSCPVCRVRGTSGLGKTRLVYEAVNHEQFSKRVIYSDADEFEGSELATTLEMDDSREAIIILDNCSREQHRAFINRYGSYSRLALITISTDRSRVSADLPLTIDRLSKDELKEILNSVYSELPGHTVDRFAKIADGYPEMALLLAERYTTDDTEQSVVEVSDSTIFDRLLVGNEQDAPDLRDVKRILTPFAFFDRINWKNNPNEKEWVIKAFNLNSDYSENTISEIVHYEKDRDVLKGEEVLSVGTIPLATYLMKSALERNSSILDSIFHENCPSRLKWTFAERIPYANTLDIVQNWSADKLYTTEWFRRYGFQADIGPIFRGLAEVTPGEALDTLEMFIGTKEREDLEKIESRRTILESLRRIAVWKEHFFGAARHLQKLAEAENDDQYVNNSTGLFADLFSPHPGPYAPTEVAPMDRYPILEDLLSSHDPDKHRVGLEAAEQVLSIRGSRGGGIPHRQGAKPAPDLWSPDTNEERIEYFEEVWKLVERNLDKLHEENFEKAVNILTSNSRKLAESEDLTPTIQNTFRELLGHQDIDANEVISATSSIVHYDADDYPEELQKSWQEFEDELTNRDFHTKLKRYIAGHNLVARSEDREEITERRIASLAEEVVENPDVISDELDWLHEASSQNAVDFGRKLAKRDHDRELIEVLLTGLQEVETDAACCMFGSYLNVITDSCEDAPKHVFDRLKDDRHLIHFFPFLVRRADPSNKAAEMILDSIRNGEIPIRKINQIEPIARGGDLSEDTFFEIGSYLLDKDTGKASGILVNLAYDFYRRDDAPRVENDMIVPALTHPDLVEGESGVTIDGHWYEWEQLAEITISQDISNGFDISEQIIDSLGQTGGVVRNRDHLDNVLRPLFEQEPKKAWGLVTEGFDDDSSRVRLEAWLAGTRVNSGESAILLVPESTLWNWVDDDPDERAPQLARCLPPMSHSGWWNLTRELLIRHGDTDDVFEELSAIERGGVFGNDLFRSRRDELKQLRRASSNPTVRRWLTQEIRAIEKFL